FGNSNDAEERSPLGLGHEGEGTMPEKAHEHADSEDPAESGPSGVGFGCRCVRAGCRSHVSILGVVSTAFKSPPRTNALETPPERGGRPEGLPPAGGVIASSCYSPFFKSRRRSRSF